MTLTPEQLAALPPCWAKEAERLARYADPDKPYETTRTRTRALQELFAALADARLKLAEAARILGNFREFLWSDYSSAKGLFPTAAGIVAQIDALLDETDMQGRKAREK